jgi:hypothetical protein
LDHLGGVEGSDLEVLATKHDILLLTSRLSALPVNHAVDHLGELRPQVVRDLQRGQFKPFLATRQKREIY